MTGRTAPSAVEVLAGVRAEEDSLVSEWMSIAAVPAPKGGESERAEIVASALERTGYPDRVWMDDSPNVYAVAGDDGGPRVTVVATLDDLDTIAELRMSPGAPLERRGSRLVGPCVETTSSDVSVVGLLRALARHRLGLRGQLLVVCVSGEETGLTGMRRLIEERRHSLGVIVEVLGGVGTVSFGAIGVKGLEVRFRSPPRHSLGGGKSLVPEALARTTLRMGALAPAPSREDWSVLRVNTVHAGSVFNHSPGEGRLTVDVRSVDAAWLDATFQRVEEEVRDVSDEVGVEGELVVHHARQAVTLPGGAENPIVRAACSAIESVGEEVTVRPWTSSNLSAAAGENIPGVAMEGTGRGGGRGTLEEWCDIDRVLSGVAADVLVLANLGMFG